MSDEIKIESEVKVMAKITRADGTIEYRELTGEVVNG